MAFPMCVIKSYILDWTGYFALKLVVNVACLNDQTVETEMVSAAVGELSSAQRTLKGWGFRLPLPTRKVRRK